MQIAKSTRRSLVAVVFGSTAAALMLLPGTVTEAHKAVTSPYNFNDHVFPILRDRCGSCHFQGGPTPMSLMTYMDALPWAESMREQLVGERMPAWYADPMGPAIKGGHRISPRELDVIVTWATGGTPQGDLTKKLPPVAAPSDWRAGTPDLVVKMPQEHTVPASTMEEQFSTVIPSGLTEDKWVKSVDLLPGSASMVREATVSLENGPVLAAWVPGEDAIAAPSGAAFKLAAGSKLKLAIRYHKHYLDEQNAVKDQTSIGLYFTDEPISGKSIESFAIDGKVADEAAGGPPQTFTGTLAGGARVVAFRPLVDQTYSSIDVHAVLANGRKVTLLRLHSQRPEWPRRYWLAEPIELPKGTKIEAVATPAPVNPDDIPSPRRDKLQVALDYVAQ
jgi:hypothetical protein